METMLKIFMFGTMVWRAMRVTSGKTKKLFASCLVIFAIIAFPVALNDIITYKLYLFFPIESEIDKMDWFSFMGSYVGAIGTIVCGWVAYRQNALMQEQQRQSDEQKLLIENQREQSIKLHEMLSQYQVKPNPRITKLKIKFYLEKECNCQQEEEKQKLYYRVFGEEVPDNIGRLLFLSINTKCRDTIPITEYEIQELKWEIAGKSYLIELKPKQKKRQISLQGKDKINILIDKKNVKENNEEELMSLFQSLRIHSNYRSYPKYGYDKSELKIKIKFINQAEEANIYEIHYRISTLNGVKIEKSECTRTEIAHENGK